MEWIAAIFGVICVYFTVKQNILCWPTGLISVSLSIFICYDAKLYSDVILNSIYVLVQFYGWYHWLYGGKGKSELPVSDLNRQLPLWIVTCIFGTVIWGFVMGRITDASVPYLDAFTTVGSLIAQWLMAQKKVENWYFWIIVDVVAIGLYWYKGLHVFSGLFAVYLILATVGLFEWKRALKLKLSGS
jgi:nicotinamide mononucleotide transporter